MQFELFEILVFGVFNFSGYKFHARKNTGECIECHQYIVEFEMYYYIYFVLCYSRLNKDRNSSLVMKQPFDGYISHLKDKNTLRSLLLQNK